MKSSKWCTVSRKGVIQEVIINIVIRLLKIRKIKFSFSTDFRWSRDFTQPIGFFHVFAKGLALNLYISTYSSTQQSFIRIFQMKLHLMWTLISFANRTWNNLVHIEWFNNWVRCQNPIAYSSVLMLVTAKSDSRVTNFRFLVNMRSPHSHVRVMAANNGVCYSCLNQIYIGRR